MSDAMDMLKAAVTIAVDAHTGQVRRVTGEPYICHPAAVAALVSEHGDEAMAAAWLHDVIEDSDVTADDLRAAGIPADVVHAVELLTRSDDEDYERDYLPRIAANPLARAVKLADLRHNLCTRRRDKYERAQAYLLAVEAENPASERS